MALRKLLGGLITKTPKTNVLIRPFQTSTARIGQTFRLPLQQIQKRHFSDNPWNPFDPTNRLDITSPFCPLNPLYKDFEFVDPLRKVDPFNVLHAEEEKPASQTSYVDHSKKILAENKSTTFKRVEERKSEPQNSNNTADNDDYRASGISNFVRGDIHK